jgi:hypothetical protein
VLTPDISQQFRARALESIPFAKAGFTYEAVRWQTYGAVHSAHITLSPAAELELTSRIQAGHASTQSIPERTAWSQTASCP